MSKLIIVGNGFDLYHGLKTKYKDFKEFLYQNKKDNFCELISEYIDENTLWSSFEDALGDLDIDQLCEDASCFLLSYSDPEWRDSANHDYQEEIRMRLSFSKNISTYFKEWVQTINEQLPNIEQYHLIKNLFDKDTIFLSFNYTSTLEVVYGIQTKQITYIHGKANSNDKLIVGHNRDNLFKDKEESDEYNNDMDDYDDGLDFRIKEGNSLIEHYFEETYKDTKTIIKQHQSFFNSLKTINEIYIFGHSLSPIDFNYFKEIRNKVSDDCEWNISCYTPLVEDILSFDEKIYLPNEDYSKIQNFIKKLNIQHHYIFNFRKVENLVDEEETKDEKEYV